MGEEAESEPYLEIKESKRIQNIYSFAPFEPL